MQKLMVMLTSSVFDWKYPFWVNLIEKIKIVSFVATIFVHYFRYQFQFKLTILIFKPNLSKLV